MLKQRLPLKLIHVLLKENLDGGLLKVLDPEGQILVSLSNSLSDTDTRHAAYTILTSLAPFLNPEQVSIIFDQLKQKLNDSGGYFKGKAFLLLKHLAPNLNTTQLDETVQPLNTALSDDLDDAFAALPSIAPALNSTQIAAIFEPLNKTLRYADVSKKTFRKRLLKPLKI